MATFKLIRAAGFLGLLLVASVPAASAANQKEIDRAIKNGAAALKARYNRAGGAPLPGVPAGGGIDQNVATTALAGLALLEAGTPVNDPAIKAITGIVRDGGYREGKTYNVALCLMYLDRLGDPADEPLIQILAIRLLVGQTRSGGWGYQCTGGLPTEIEKQLREIKADHKPGKLHPDVEKYGEWLVASRTQNGGTVVVAGDDNSNTQFALLAIWMSRKHGVPVETALDLVEKRFMESQDQRTGNWPYSGPIVGMSGGIPGTPSMYCAGLLGMATSMARREERRLKTDQPPPKPNTPQKTDTKPNDPFYNPPAKDPPKKPAAKGPADARDLVVQRAFAGLGLTFADLARGGNGFLTSQTHGNGDLYFFWSMERVGVVYGVDKIGGIDWYDVGSTVIVRSQSPDGSWSMGSYGPEVNTSFAILFLCRSNLARDLSSKVQKDPTSTEMRAGNGPSANDLLPNRPITPIATAVPEPIINLPNPTGDEAITLASKMLKSSNTDWAKLLAATRDAKGATNTRALVLTATNTIGERKKAAREALAERLCRMTPATLRTMLKSDQAELRRAAALACAMKDDKSHVSDLIDMLTDADDSVVRAAHAGLKSLTGKDFGPAAGASSGQKALAVSEWKEWYAKEKK